MLKRKSALVRSPSEAQFDRLTQLYRIVAGIEDGLGSENTDSGHVVPCSESSFSSARRTAFPAVYRFVPMSAAKFRRDFSAISGVASLLSFAAAYRPEFGLIGDPARFYPTKSDRGNFWVCVFLRARRGLGKNILLRFQRTET